MSNSQRERRLHRRWELACPIAIDVGNGRPLVQSRSENVSNGGVYLTVGGDALPADGLTGRLAVRLSLPRSTPNSFMFEEVRADATVVRHLPLAGQPRAALALRFVQPLRLDLEE